MEAIKSSHEYVHLERELCEAILLHLADDLACYSICNPLPPAAQKIAVLLAKVISVVEHETENP